MKTAAMLQRLSHAARTSSGGGGGGGLKGRESSFQDESPQDEAGRESVIEVGQRERLCCG